jgi:hypothetical protein
VIRLETQREQRGHFNLIHHDTGFKADIYLGGRDELHLWGLANARLVAIGEEQVSLAPPEYVIIRKLEYFREGGSPKHLRDVRGILSALGDEWDRASLDHLIGTHGLSREWKAVEDSDR